MSIDDKKEWNEFLADVLKSQWKNVPTEEELVDRLNAMMHRRNAFAGRAENSAKMTGDRRGEYWPNRVWEKGAIYGLADIQTGLAGADEAGLWRPNQGNHKK